MIHDKNTSDFKETNYREFNGNTFGFRTFFGTFVNNTTCVNLVGVCVDDYWSRMNHYEWNNHFHLSMGDMDSREHHGLHGLMYNVIIIWDTLNFILSSLESLEPFFAMSPAMSWTWYWTFLEQKWKLIRNRKMCVFSSTLMFWLAKVLEREFP